MSGTPIDRVAVAFARVLRGAGLSVPVGSVIVFARGLGTLGLDDPDLVYWAGRATLVRRPEDVDAFDRAFTAFFGGGRNTTPTSTTETVTVAVEVPVSRWSPTEVLRHADLATCTDDERDELHRLIGELRMHAALRPSRRRRAVHHGRGRPDLRRTVRDAMRTNGEPFHIAATRRGERARRVVILLDVSGSMEPYARALARFAHALVTARPRGHVEVFTLGTRLHRITRDLVTHDPDVALANVGETVADWSGGTRLGESLRAFNDEWGVRGVARGATVIVLSDGWDRGAPEQLGTEVARLRRVAHRLVWVNPLKATAGYEPLARGMAAALPYVDEFVEGHSIAALEDLAQLVARA